MLFFIARSREQARAYEQAINAAHVVVLEGANEPSHGFDRPAASPTLGYAQLHYATPEVRIEGVWFGQGPCTLGGSPRLHVVPKRGEFTGDRVYEADTLPVLVRLTADGELEALDLPDGGVDAVGQTAEPDPDPTPDRPSGGRRARRRKPPRGDSAPDPEPRGSAPDWRGDEHGDG